METAKVEIRKDNVCIPGFVVISQSPSLYITPQTYKENDRLVSGQWQSLSSFHNKNHVFLDYTLNSPNCRTQTANKNFRALHILRFRNFIISVSSFYHILFYLTNYFKKILKFII